ncbi:class F sortase [Streptomyces fuscigenes]|uniref:class F sortase n=1 Tax=Streptomyces fuscigenes TaxID=1528880 RepID=UPI001F22CC1D|nr:class F sortase [Streptomyces fuscigenes]MCF3964440.1 class F sortase [Streptomyces fuscigenes]
MTANGAKGRAWGLATVACVGIWLVQAGLRPVTPPAPSPAQALSRAESGAEGRGATPAGARPGPAPLAASRPVRLRIPRIGVDAPVRGLSLTRDGRLSAPPADDTNLAGWYEHGTSPGQSGTAIVAGHVDTARGPAVFYELGTLRKGDRIEVVRRDGRTALFGVDAVEVYKNSAFPSHKVYAPARRPELRVITCGGGFSPGTGYQGNVVAYAHLTGTRG